MSPTRIAGIVAATNALEPDLVVLLGDYVAGLNVVTRGDAQAQARRPGRTRPDAVGRHRQPERLDPGGVGAGSPESSRQRTPSNPTSWSCSATTLRG
jgi:hypothetical protein